MYAVSVGTHSLSLYRYTKNSFTDKDIMSLVFFFVAVDVMTCDIKLNDTITVALLVQKDHMLHNMLFCNLFRTISSEVTRLK